MKRGGTNPTAAAIGVLQILEPHAGPLSTEVREGVIGFLGEMPSFEGGLRANAGAPLADLLSTFTGCWTLAQLGALDAAEPAGALEYARGVERAAGGFRGGVWDEGHDVEYTFYGLGVLALFTP